MPTAVSVHTKHGAISFAEAHEGDLLAIWRPSGHLREAGCDLTCQLGRRSAAVGIHRVNVNTAPEDDLLSIWRPTSLGYVAFSFDWDWSRAEHELRWSLELNSSLPQAHAHYAQYLLFVGGRPDQSLQEMQQAYALDPLLPQANGDMAWFLFLARRYTESIEAARRVGRDDHIMALSYAELGQSEQAIAAADRAVKSTQNPVILSQAAAAYALAGRKDTARAMISGIEGQARERYVCGFNVASLYSVLGDKEQAFAWLAKAQSDRSD